VSLLKVAPLHLYSYDYLQRLDKSAASDTIIRRASNVQGSVGLLPADVYQGRRSRSISGEDLCSQLAHNSPLTDNVTFQGLSMPVFGATLENATLFFTYNFVQGHLRGMSGQEVAQSTSTSSIEADAERPLSMAQLSIAAACAGAVTSFVLTPVELIKCKMQVQMISREIDILSGKAGNISPSTLKTPSMTGAASIPTRAISTRAFAGLDGPVKLITDTVRREGPSGLWLGQTGTLIRETGGAIAWFLGFEWACRMVIERKKKYTGQSDVTKKDLSSIQLIGAGALAGISYNVVLFPADSVKSTMQTERELSGNRPNADGSAWKKTGFLSTFKRIYSTKGVRGLYAGCAVTCMRSAPSSALIFLMYNKLEALADDFGI
jgi:ornithine carrier protein